MNAVENKIVNHRVNENAMGAGATKGAGKMLGNQGRFNLKNVLTAALAAGAAMVAQPSHSDAALITLSNGNSIVNINPDGESGNVDGVYNWTVDDTMQASQQWFWVQVGGSGAAQPLTNLTSTNQLMSNLVTLTYTYPTFLATVQYQLIGGAAGSDYSELSETAQITNTTTGAEMARLLNYTDLIPGGAPTAAETNVEQITGAGDMVSELGQMEGGSQIAALLTGSTMNLPSEYRAADASTLLSAFSAGSLPLTDAVGDNSATAAFALEDDNNALGASQTFGATVEQQIGPENQLNVTVPEPTTAVAFGGLAGVLLLRPRRRDARRNAFLPQVALA
jgi:hypothetical protein